VEVVAPTTYRLAPWTSPSRAVRRVRQPAHVAVQALLARSA
jgi:hypothetical protein